jgi:putative protease
MSNAASQNAAIDSPSPPPPELLAPAGDADCARAAVENGADAIYFGLRGGLNARARAVNFASGELPELMQYLHRRGVKGYITLNTLVFHNELAEFERAVRLTIAAGVDAVLVQDLGAARLIRAVCPDWPLHASTQMSLTSGEAIAAAESLGIERVVLARELSLQEIRQIRSQTRLGLEVFVHGALCIAVSGQCMASFAMGGRSANRGQCAQPCRLPYELIRDGDEVELGDRRHLLSPQDLAAYDLLPELIAAGVTAVKIEGRLKSAQYVAAVTRHYRQTIDAAAAGRAADRAPQQIADLEVAFSRGFSHGWLEGCDHKTLVHGQNSAKRGVYLGEVRAVRKDRVAVELIGSVQRGDGLVFEGDRSDQSEQGGRVYEVFRRGRSLDEPVADGLVELAFGNDAIDLNKLSVGQKVWKTDDPQLTRRLRKTYSGQQNRRVALDLTVEAAPGRALRISARADSGAACRIASPQVLEEARKHPLTAATLAEQLGRLGGTAYRLRHIDARIHGRPMAPLSVLGSLRHEMVEQLDASIAQRPTPAMAADSPLPALRSSLPPRQVATEDVSPQWHVLCRRLEQLPPAIAAGADSVVADFQNVGQYRAVVELAHSLGKEILLATSRIQKPGEMESLCAMLQCGADGLLARNLAAAALCAEQQMPFVADFSLHAANELTVQYLHDLGARRVTAAYDCQGEHLFDLAAAAPPQWLEVVVQQHLPMFHMQHCVLCATIAPGNDRRDCGQPCLRHDFRLRDRLGIDHPLRADAACRNTVFHAERQSMANVVPRLRSLGVRHFRVELLDETGDEIGRAIREWASPPKLL